MPPTRPRVALTCHWCGGPLHRLPSQLRQSPARHCSRACLHADWITRFWDKVDRDDGDGCWRWDGPTDPDGFARYVRQGRAQGTAHVAYGLAYGAVPSGYGVRPRCGERRCVRPDHLALVPAVGGAPPRPADARVPHARLTRATVATIRARHAAGGVRQQALAAEYGLSPGHMSRLLRGASWRSNVPAPASAGVAPSPPGRASPPRCGIWWPRTGTRPARPWPRCTGTALVARHRGVVSTRPGGRWGRGAVRRRIP